MSFFKKLFEKYYKYKCIDCGLKHDTERCPDCFKQCQNCKIYSPTKLLTEIGSKGFFHRYCIPEGYSYECQSCGENGYIFDNSICVRCKFRTHKECLECCEECKVNCCKTCKKDKSFCNRCFNKDLKTYKCSICNEEKSVKHYIKVQSCNGCK